MANLDNPAGRLHAFLVAYQEAATNGGNVRVTWGAALDLNDPVAIHLKLSEIGGLILEVHRAVSRQGRPAYRELCSHHIPEWASPFNTPLNATAPVVPSSALLGLNAISDFLSERASEGVLPDDEERRSLREEVWMTIEETKEADDVPVEVRQVILERLHQIIWALDHVQVGGPEAVAAAVERLVASLVIHGQTPKSNLAKRCWNLVEVFFRTLKRGPEIREGLEGWSDVLGIGPGV